MQTIYTQIGSKGQLVIPAELREEMKLSIGTKGSGPGGRSSTNGNALVRARSPRGSSTASSAASQVPAWNAKPSTGKTKNNDLYPGRQCPPPIHRQGRCDNPPKAAYSQCSHTSLSLRLEWASHRHGIHDRETFQGPAFAGSKSRASARSRAAAGWTRPYSWNRSLSRADADVALASLGKLKRQLPSPTCQR